jgi:hypothetical protein
LLPKPEKKLLNRPPDDLEQIQRTWPAVRNAEGGNVFTGYWELDKASFQVDGPPVVFCSIGGKCLSQSIAASQSTASIVVGLTLLPTVERLITFEDASALRLDGHPNAARLLYTSGAKAHEIPDLLRDALCFPLGTSDNKRIEAIRDSRNKIAYDGVPPVPLNEAMAVVRDLRTVAAKMGQHVVEHFFVLEAYA